MLMGKTIFQMIGIIASTVAATTLFFVAVTGGTPNVELAIGLGGLMAWACGLQCGELFK